MTPSLLRRNKINVRSNKRQLKKKKKLRCKMVYEVNNLYHVLKEDIAQMEKAVSVHENI